MAIRNAWRVGRYLMQDDESGFIRYDDQMVERWDGVWFQRSGNEDEIARHPQEFVKAFNDPRPLKDVRPRADSSATFFIDASKGLPTGAARHLFPNDAAIEQGMTIAASANTAVSGNSFVVRD